MDTGMFRESPSAERRERAEQQVRKMGYDFHISQFDVSLADNNRLAFGLQWSNEGVAPFYRDWKPRLAIIAGGKVFAVQELDVDLRSIMPETESQQVTGAWELAELPADSWTVAISIPNPMPGGKPVRFANETQDAELPGWLSLTRFDVTNRAFVEVVSK